MSATATARNAYTATSAPTRTQMDIEYDAIAKTTHRLQVAAGQGPNGFAELVSALDQNRKLWTVFATDVVDKRNGLPAELRARLFYLAEFTNHHTSQVLARKASIEPLVEINTAIMRGLRKEKAA